MRSAVIRNGIKARIKFDVMRKLSIWAIVYASVISASLVVGAANGLSRVNFGDPDSEALHNLRIEGGSEVVDYSALEEWIVRAYDSQDNSAGQLLSGPARATTSAEEAAQLYAGESSRDKDIDEWRYSQRGKGRWLKFEFNREIRELEFGLDFARVIGPHPMAQYVVEITSDGEDWDRVYTGEAPGSEAIDGFDEVIPAENAKAVRLVLVDDGNINLRRVDLGGLPHLPNERTTPGLGEPARRLLPPQWQWTEEKPWGSSLFITVEVDPDKKNYFTSRFWGGEWGRELGRLIVLADGKLLSHTRHGDLEPLDTASTRGSGGPFPSRFYYSTTPLPRSLTEGKSNVELEIRHFGWAYTNATSLDRMYFPIESHSKALYNAYTHTDPFFQPPAEEPQGEKPPMVRRSEQLDEMERQYQSQREQLIDRLDSDLERLAEGEEVGARRLYDLARSYHIDWLPFHQDERIPKNILKMLDHHILSTENFRGVRGNPAEPLVEIFLEMSDYYGNSRVLNEEIMTDDGEIKRRDLYADAFVKAQDSQLSARRGFTNQAHWSDGHIYQLNLALEILAPERAMAEKDARRIVLEMVGLLPWTGSWSERRFPDDPDEMAPLYTYQAQGRERGFVAGYGEMQGGVGRMARFFEDAPRTRDRILEQARRVLEGRIHLRYPHWDEDGYALMRGHSVIGCRHTFYPGRADNPHSYANLSTVARMDGNELAIELVHRSVMEGQAYGMGASIEDLRGWRYYRQWLEKQEDKTELMELPMEGGDFIWADEDNAMLVFKRGDSRAYVNFMFANPRGVNSLARIQYTTPSIDRLATVRASSDVEDTGDYFVRGDADQWITNNRSGPWAVIPGLESYWGGERLPKAEGRIPNLGDFHEIRFGDYYIAMNTTADKTFELNLGDYIDSAQTGVNLVTGERDLFDPDRTYSLAPRSTKVLYLGK